VLVFSLVQGHPNDPIIHSQLSLSTN